MKNLALAQHLGIDVFEFEGTYYVGATQEEFDKLDAESEDSFDEAYVESEYTRLDDEIVESTYNESEFEAEGGTYLVCTDDEADQLWDESLDNYIDDCILSELPSQYQLYFDNEKWKRDARTDGRGHSLSGYDGEEHEVTVKEHSDEHQTFYIYRTN